MPSILEAGGLSIFGTKYTISEISSSGSIDIKPSGDTDDYFTLTTESDIPTLTATGATGFRFASHIGIMDSVQAYQIATCGEDFVLTDNFGRFGYYSQVRASKTTAAYTGTIVAGYFEARLNAANTQDWSHGTSSLNAIHAEISSFGTNGVTAGTVAFASDILLTFDLKQYTANYTSIAGIRINAPGYGVGVSPTNFFAIYIETPTGAATINRAIHVAGGDVFFGGTVIHEVNQVLQWRNNAGTPYTVLSGANAEVNIYSPVGSLHLLYNNAQDVSIWGVGGTAGTGQTFSLQGSASSAGATLQDSPTMSWKAQYWSGGAANTSWEYTVLHDMQTAGATPKSQALHKINNVSILTLENNNGTPQVIVAIPAADPGIAGALYSGAANAVFISAG